MPLPITLLSCLSKVCEYVLVNHLKEFLDSHDVLIQEQFGFRACHSMQHQLWRILELLHDGTRSSGVTGAIFLYVPKAFDKMWHIVLLFNLVTLGLPGQLTKIYVDYFQNRTFVVRVGTTFSNPKPILSPFPQGSLSRLTLFNTYVNDIPKEPDIDLAIFADDTPMLHRYKHALQVFTKIQNYLDKISARLKKCRIKVVNAKGAAIFFTNTRFTPDANLNFKLYDQPIPWKSDYKYLGIHLDSKLTWVKHITETLNLHANAAMCSLHTLLAYHNFLSIKNKLLYKSMTSPIITYGSAARDNASKTHLERI